MKNRQLNKKQSRKTRSKRAIKNQGNRNGRTKNIEAPVSISRVLKTESPNFSKGKTVTVKHSEFIENVIQFQTFHAKKFAINPGLMGTFPWLAGISPSFEKYRFKKLHFRYEVLTATTSGGKIMLIPDFNPADGPPISKSEALTYEFAVGSQPWLSFSLKVPEKYLRSYNEYFIRGQDLAPNLDIKTYDPLNLYLCTDGAIGDQLVAGELWVDYEIELINPIGQPNLVLPSDLYAESLLINVNAPGEDASAIFGYSEHRTVQGGLDVTISPSQLTFNSNWVGICSCYWLVSADANSDIILPPEFHVANDVSGWDQADIEWTIWTPAIGPGAMFVLGTVPIQASAGQVFSPKPVQDSAPADALIQSAYYFAPMWLDTHNPPFINPFPMMKQIKKKTTLPVMKRSNKKPSNVKPKKVEVIEFTPNSTFVKSRKGNGGDDDSSTSTRFTMN